MFDPYERAEEIARLNGGSVFAMEALNSMHLPRPYTCGKLEHIGYTKKGFKKYVSSERCIHSGLFERASIFYSDLITEMSIQA